MNTNKFLSGVTPVPYMHNITMQFANNVITGLEQLIWRDNAYKLVSLPYLYSVGKIKEHQWIEDVTRHYGPIFVMGECRNLYTYLGPDMTPIVSGYKHFMSPTLSMVRKKIVHTRDFPDYVTDIERKGLTHRIAHLSVRFEHRLFVLCSAGILWVIGTDIDYTGEWKRLYKRTVNALKMEVLKELVNKRKRELDAAEKVVKKARLALDT